MTKQNNLFLATLDALHKSGVFEYIILIGAGAIIFTGFILITLLKYLW